MTFPRGACHGDISSAQNVLVTITDHIILHRMVPRTGSQIPHDDNHSAPFLATIQQLPTHVPESLLGRHMESWQTHPVTGLAFLCATSLANKFKRDMVRVTSSTWHGQSWKWSAATRLFIHHLFNNFCDSTAKEHPSSVSVLINCLSICTS